MTVIVHCTLQETMIVYSSDLYRMGSVALLVLSMIPTKTSISLLSFSSISQQLQKTWKSK